MKQIGVGEDYCIPPTFRREHQFRITYFELQTILGIVLSSPDWTLPTLPQGICILYPAHDRISSVTHRKDYKPFQSVFQE